MDRRRERVVLLLLILGHALLAGAYSVWNPLGEAPDEADHWAYLAYLANERELPAGPRVTQSKHPPLYHATAAAVASLAASGMDLFLRPNPDVSIQPVPNWSPNFFVHPSDEDWPWRGDALAFHLARLWSVLLSAATVAAAYFLARAALPAHPGIALTAAGILAFIPEFAFIGGSINNDNGAALLGALTVWGALSILNGRSRWPHGWWTPLAMGLGLLVKVSTVALWPAVFLAVILGAAAGRMSEGAPLTGWLHATAATWRRWVIGGLGILAAALALGSPWLLRNWRLYGDPLGLELTRQTVDLRTAAWSWADTTWLLSGWFRSFWGKFGGAGHIPMPGWIYWLLAAACLIALAGVVKVWFTRSEAGSRPAIGLLMLSVVLVALGIWRYSLLALGTDQGRLLYPAVGPLAALFALGLSAWAPARRRSAAATAVILAFALLGVYGLTGVIRPAFAPPAPLTDAEAAQLSHEDAVQFAAADHPLLLLD